MAKIKDFFIFQPKSKVPAKNGKDTGFYPFYTSSSIQKKFIDEFNYDGESIILGTGGWPSVHFQNKKFAVSSDCVVLKSDKYSAKLLYYYLYGNIHILKKGFQGARLEHISKKYIENIEIPNIDIRIQNEITYTLDKIQSLIDKRKKTIELIDEIIKSTFLSMFGDPINIPIEKKMSLKNLGNWQSGGTPKRSVKEYFVGNNLWYSSGELNEIFISKSKESISDEALKNSSAKIIEKGSLLLGMYDTAALKSSITKVKASCNQAIAFAKLDERICNPIYVYYSVQLSKKYYLNQRLGARQQNLNLMSIKNIEIPKADVKLQNKFERKVLLLLNKKLKLQNSQDLLETLFKSFIKKAFIEKKLEEKDELNKYLNDVFLQQDLLGRIKTQDFQLYEEYQNAKEILFELLESGKSIVSQKCDDSGKIQIL